MTLTFGSLFAGVGGFDLGFEAAGYKCRFQVEWDKNCQQTLAHHWPDVPRWSDVSDVNGADLPPVDVITYGFPCQDLSVAGKRAGLDGKRSHLFFQAIRIITEMREATNGRYPTWAVAENVAGLLNADGGSAMARVVDELATAGAVVIEWATLDAQWFGVPQRRRRVFITSCFDSATANRCPDPLLPVAPSRQRHPEEGRKTWEDIAGSLACRSNSRGSTDVEGVGTYVPVAFGTSSIAQYSEGVGTLRAQGGDLGGGSEMLVTDTVGPLTPKSATVRGTETTDSGHLITEPIGFSHTQGIDCQPSTEHFPTLRGEGGGQAVAQPIGFVAEGGSHSVTPLDNLSPTIRVGSGIGIPSPPAVVQPDLAVRRLTPLECERLMGWPDNHTLHRADGKTNPDSTRYKMCGNGVASPVAAWIARHLANTLTQ